MIDNKQIKTLLSGILSGDDLKINQATKEIIESMFVNNSNFIIEVLSEEIERNLK